MVSKALHHLHRRACSLLSVCSLHHFSAFLSHSFLHVKFPSLEREEGNAGVRESSLDRVGPKKVQPRMQERMGGMLLGKRHWGRGPWVWQKRLECTRVSFALLCFAYVDTRVLGFCGWGCTCVWTAFCWLLCLEDNLWHNWVVSLPFTFSLPRICFFLVSAFA